MKRQRGSGPVTTTLRRWELAYRELSRRRHFWTPTATAFRAFWAQHGRTALHTSVLVLGLAAQLVLLWLAGEAIDLYVSAVELWAELARKHLELTL